MKLRILYSVIFVSFIFSCEKDHVAVIPIPEDRHDDITVASAKTLGFNPELLMEMTNLNKNGFYENVHSILIAKDNQLVYEEYFVNEAIESVQSVTKSFTSAIVGVAIDQYGLSSEEVIYPYFPEIDAVYWKDGKEEITIEDLLTMSSGLQWNETSIPYSDPANDAVQMNQSNDWIKFVLERSLTSTPGSLFNYNSGLTIVLGEIVKRKSGLNIAELCENHLFTPMKINKVFWASSDSNGVYHAGGGLHLNPRGMLKFGLLYLNEGIWGNSQLINKTWITRSTTQQGSGNEYGYQWWLDNYLVEGKTYPVYYAWGNLGQFIVVVKDLQLVTVFTGDLEDNEAARNQVRQMMKKYIMPSF